MSLINLKSFCQRLLDTIKAIAKNIKALGTKIDGIEGELNEVKKTGIKNLEFSGEKEKTLSIQFNDGSRKKASFTDLDTTYPKGKLEDLTEGKNIAESVWSSNVLSTWADNYLKRRGGDVYGWINLTSPNSGLSRNVESVLSNYTDYPIVQLSGLNSNKIGYCLSSSKRDSYGYIGNEHNDHAISWDFNNRVGIGNVSTPTATLDVRGDLKVSELPITDNTKVNEELRVGQDGLFYKIKKPVLNELPHGYCSGFFAEVKKPFFGQLREGFPVLSDDYTPMWLANINGGLEGKFTALISGVVLIDSKVVSINYNEKIDSKDIYFAISNFQLTNDINSEGRNKIFYGKVITIVNQTKYLIRIG